MPRRPKYKFKYATEGYGATFTGKKGDVMIMFDKKLGVRGAFFPKNSKQWFTGRTIDVKVKRVKKK